MSVAPSSHVPSPARRADLQSTMKHRRCDDALPHSPLDFAHPLEVRGPGMEGAAILEELAPAVALILLKTLRMAQWGTRPTTPSAGRCANCRERETPGSGRSRRRWRRSTPSFAIFASRRAGGRGDHAPREQKKRAGAGGLPPARQGASEGDVGGALRVGKLPGGMNCAGVVAEGYAERGGIGISRGQIRPLLSQAVAVQG